MYRPGIRGHIGIDTVHSKELTQAPDAGTGSPSSTWFMGPTRESGALEDDHIIGGPIFAGSETVSEQITDLP